MASRSSAACATRSPMPGASPMKSTTSIRTEPARPRTTRWSTSAPPPEPGAGEVQIRIKAAALNHLDLWGFRGMAFVKRKLPLVVGAEAAGEIAAVGPEVTDFTPSDRVVMYGALTCGACKACREG